MREDRARCGDPGEARRRLDDALRFRGEPDWFSVMIADDGALIGYAVPALIDGMAVIAELGVAQAHRRRRYGLRLLTHAVTTLAGAGATEIVADTDQANTTSSGSAVCPELVGHGIGRRVHEAPGIPNYWALGLAQPLTEGLVVTIEPIIAAGHGAVRTTSDGWTVTTRDGSYAAHPEHTIVVTTGSPLILTA